MVPAPASTLSGNGGAWRRPTVVLAALTLLVTAGGGAISLQREQERLHEQRLAALELRQAATTQAEEDLREAVLSRLDALREAVDRLHDDLHRENDVLIRRVETLERRGR